jgi:hypothetical protein
MKESRPVRMALILADGRTDAGRDEASRHFSQSMRTRRKDGGQNLSIYNFGQNMWSTRITMHVPLSSTQDNFPLPYWWERHFLSVSGDGCVLHRTPIILNEEHEVPRKKKTILPRSMNEKHANRAAVDGISRQAGTLSRWVRILNSIFYFWVRSGRTRQYLQRKIEVPSCDHC